MVMRPDSPVENMSQDEDWFKEYEWMNEQENFEEEFLNSLHIEELSKVAQAIDDELMEIAQNLDEMILSTDTADSTSPTNQNLDILSSSSLNPNAEEFIPTFALSR